MGRGMARNRADRAQGRLAAAVAVAVGVGGLVACSTAASAASAGSKAPFSRQGVVFADTGVANPDVVASGSGQWRMYYMQNGSVLSAVSTSASARRFTLEGTRLANAEHPAIAQLPDSRTRMYFSRRGPGANGDILSAISSNGLDFTEEPGIRLAVGPAGAPDEAGMIHPSVVPTPDGGWRLYYDAERAATDANDLGWGDAIMSASSKDGLTFTRDSGTRISPRTKGLPSSFMVWSPDVIRSGNSRGTYTMFFTSDANSKQRKRSGAFQAKSKDGLNFKVSPARPVLGVDPSVGEIRQGPGGPTGVPQDPFVIDLANGSQRMFYWQSEKGTLTAVRK